MKALFLSYAIAPRSLQGYTAAVTFLLLAMLFGSLFFAGREFLFFRMTKEALHRTNGLLWAAGSAMALFTLLFVLLRRPWLMGMVLIIGSALVYSTVGDGVRNQLKRY